MELDCWDGDNNDPEITHGFFMCQTIRFKVRKLLGHLAAKTQPIKNRQSFLLKCKETHEAMLHNAYILNLVPIILLYASETSSIRYD